MTVYGLWKTYGAPRKIGAMTLTRILTEAGYVQLKGCKEEVCILKTLNKAEIEQVLDSWQNQSCLARWWYSRKAVHTGPHRRK